MFRRLILDSSAALFTVSALITAVSIYVAIAWRALRMKRPQLQRFGSLPFDVETPAAAAPLAAAPCGSPGRAGAESSVD